MINLLKIASVPKRNFFLLGLLDANLIGNHWPTYSKIFHLKNQFYVKFSIKAVNLVLDLAVFLQVLVF